MPIRKSKNKEIQEARDYCLRLIAIRPRSEKEISDKLKKKAYWPQTIEEVLDHLKKLKFIDDRLFAKLWLESRVKKPLALTRLRYELSRKGIASDIIDNALGVLKNSYDEPGVIEELIGRQLKKMKDVCDEKTKARLYAFLIRRGYSRDLVLEALERHLESQNVFLDNETADY